MQADRNGVVRVPAPEGTSNILEVLAGKHWTAWGTGTLVGESTIFTIPLADYLPNDPGALYAVSFTLTFVTSMAAVSINYEQEDEFCPNLGGRCFVDSGYLTVSAEAGPLSPLVDAEPGQIFQGTFYIGRLAGTLGSNSDSVKLSFDAGELVGISYFYSVSLTRLPS